MARVRGLINEDSPLHIVIGRVGVVAIGVISAPIIARTIGPIGRGETATVAAITYLLPVLCGFGMPLEVRRRSAIGEAGPYVRGVRLTAILLTPVAVAVALVLDFLVFVQFSSGARLAAVCAVCLAPLTTIWMAEANALVGEGRTRAFLLLQVSQPASYLMGILIAISVGVASTGFVILSGMVATVVTFVLSLTCSRTTLRGQRSALSSVLRPAWPFAGSAIAEASSNRLDQVLILPLAGAYQAGIYSVAVTVATAPMAFAQALGSRYFNDAATASAEQRPQTEIDALRRSFALFPGLCLALGIATPIAVPLVFGREFQDATTVVWVALAAGSLSMVAYVGSLLLAARSAGWRMTGAQVAALMGSTALLVLLAPGEGAIGAACATVVGSIILVTLVLRFLQLPVWLVAPRLKDVRASIFDLASFGK